MGNRENKTKEEIVEGFSLRLITPPCACEPVLEVETDLADSGAQSGSVSSSWLVILPMANCHIFQVKESEPGPFDFNVVVFLLAIKEAVFNTQVAGSILLLLYEEHSFWN